MQIFLFFALFISVIAVVFAVQNNAPTIVSFFFWKFNGSLALVLLSSLAAGSLISFFFSLPTNIRARWTIRQQRKKLSDLEANLAAKDKNLEEIQLQLDEMLKKDEPQKPGEIQSIEAKEIKMLDKN